jgi:hypothetical protein
MHGDITFVCACHAKTGKHENSASIGREGGGEGPSDKTPTHLHFSNMKTRPLGGKLQ